MKKAMVVLVLLAMAAMATENWNGWNDTCTVDDFGADSVKYSAAFDVAKYEDIVVMVKCDDTSSDGFASDSLNFRYGYQGGTETKTSAGVIDTAWEPTLWLDSMELANIGVVTAGTANGWIDTSNISGWAYQITNVSKDAEWEWRPIIRYVFEGLSDNIGLSFLKLNVQHVRRLGTYTNRD